MLVRVTFHGGPRDGESQIFFSPPECLTCITRISEPPLISQDPCPERKMFNHHLYRRVAKVGDHAVYAHQEVR